MAATGPGRPGPRGYRGGVEFAQLAETILAQNNFGNTRSGSLAGPIGAFIIVALAVTTVLLIRNMNARIRRLPARFEQPPANGPGGGADPGPDPESDPERRTG